MKHIFNWSIAILLIALVVVAYPTVFSHNVSAQDAGVVSGSGESVRDALSGNTVNKNVFVALLASLRSSSFDLGFFSLNTFTSLIDFSVNIDPQPVGRRNPFARIGNNDNPDTTGTGDLGSLFDDAFSGLEF